MPRLALDDDALALEHGIAAQTHQLQRGQHRRQRIAQLVAEHRRATSSWRGWPTASRRPRPRQIAHFEGDEDGSLRWSMAPVASRIGW